MVAARRIGRQVIAAMGRDDFKIRKAIERALKDQMLQCNRRRQRIADSVRQPAVAGQSLGELGRTERVNEKYRAELLGLGPHRMKSRV